MKRIMKIKLWRHLPAGEKAKIEKGWLESETESGSVDGRSGSMKAKLLSKNES